MNEEETAMPMIIEVFIMIGLAIAVGLFYGKTNALAVIIPIVVLAVPIDRKLKKEWPDWAEVWFLSPFDKARFMFASGISALIVLPTYFLIIEPLIN